MEQYYFIQQKGEKKGPFKLNELKSENIFFDELVWRSDDDKWKKASEFEELAGIYLIKPPLTPLEIEKKEIDKEFFKKVIPNTLGIYFILFLIISISSFLIANSSWEEFKKPYITNQNNVGKNSYDVKSQELDSHKNALEADTEELKKLRSKLKVAPGGEKIGIRYLINNKKIDSSYRMAVISNWEFDNSFTTNSNQTVIQPIYNIPENIVSEEDGYSYSQSFLFRPFYAYFSKIYLTREEQNSSGKLFINLTLSSFSLLLLALLINLIILYFIKMSKANK